MKSEYILKELANTFHNNKDKYLAHKIIQKKLKDLCCDMNFIHNAIKECISNPKFFYNANNLYFYLLVEGDVIIAINLFPPIYDKAENITHDNIHHHGWRLLTTGVISGNGYETINFVKKSHLNVIGEEVKLKIEKAYRHTIGSLQFIDSEQAHVVFHPQSTTATLALWSAKKNLTNQKIKRILKNYPAFGKFTSNLVHKTGLSKFLGLNQKERVQFVPKNGKIIFNPNPAKEIDGPNQEIIQCMFKFFEQIKLNDSLFFNKIKNFAQKETHTLFDKLISGEPIADLGIKGDIRRRFSKKEILEALKNNSHD